MDKPGKADPFPFSLFMLFVVYYMAQPFYLTYIGVFQSYMGMSKTMIGLVGAGIALVMLFVKPVLGALTDKARNKNDMVFKLLLISSVTVTETSL